MFVFASLWIKLSKKTTKTDLLILPPQMNQKSGSSHTVTSLLNLSTCHRNILLHLMCNKRNKKRSCKSYHFVLRQECCIRKSVVLVARKIKSWNTLTFSTCVKELPTSFVYGPFNSNLNQIKSAQNQDVKSTFRELHFSDGRAVERAWIWQNKI